MNEPTPQNLLTKQDDQLELVARYAPYLYFDQHEPFLPSMVGYTVFEQDGSSRSFPRQIELPTGATFAIEYALWWDWDIEHLYELEHIWIWIDDSGKLIYAEGSWHGFYHELIHDDHLSQIDGHVVACSEPGKHAFAPAPEWYQPRYNETIKACQQPGKDGLLVTDLYKDTILSKTDTIDEAVRQYLQRFAFEPSFHFTKEHLVDTSQLVPWPALEAWIPERINWWVEQLTG